MPVSFPADLVHVHVHVFCAISWCVTCLFIQALFTTVQDFLKLEKIEYGGVKGNLLSEQTQGIFTEFNDHYKVFTDSAYDPLNLDDDVSRVSYSIFLLEVCS